MDNKKIILILVIVIVILISMISLTLFNSYKEVDSNYISAPMPNEKVKFTGTYLGPYEGIYNLDEGSGVIQVGSAYVIVSTSKLQGLEDQTITVKGFFINDKIDKDTVQIGNKFVTGDSFVIEEVL